MTEFIIEGLDTGIFAVYFRTLTEMLSLPDIKRIDGSGKKIQLTFHASEGKERVELGVLIGILCGSHGACYTGIYKKV